MTKHYRPNCVDPNCLDPSQLTPGIIRSQSTDLWHPIQVILIQIILISRILIPAIPIPAILIPIKDAKGTGDHVV
jgi:hypothetical protein